MIRILIAPLVLALLMSCGSRSGGNASVTRVGGGPITSACMQAGRSGATLQRCGCLQSVANSELNSSDQRLGASFFEDPHRAQEIRQSASRNHEDFWDRWNAFSEKAAELCK